MRILRNGEMDCAECPQCGVHLAQKSELRAHQISHEPQLRTKIRAELTSNLSSTSASDKNRAELSSNLCARELRTAGLTPHFHAELL